MGSVYQRSATCKGLYQDFTGMVSFNSHKNSLKIVTLCPHFIQKQAEAQTESFAHHEELISG